MSLIADLSRVKTEEDVKDAYIKALGLKTYSKGLVDIQTEEIWFEAKESATPPILMFTQLLFYVRAARKRGEKIPPFLAVVDREKAAIMDTAKALPILSDKSIRWPTSASKVGKEVAAQAAPHIETHFVLYKIATHEKEFVGAVKAALKAGKLIRTPITPDNLRQVFDKWVEMVGRELDDVSESDYALLFFADIMHDGKKSAISNLPARLLHEDERPVFLLNGKTYAMESDKGYRKFWAIYHRPPDEEYRGYLLERRDSLLPIDERSFKGAFYTPLDIVDKAYDTLRELLGKNWQQNYIVWDMCCGVGNLEVKHSNHRNVYMSTLDQADVDVMAASRTCVAGKKFQYDYLNDDVSESGIVDYTISNKVPQELRQAISDSMRKKKGTKKILVLINPPYAEAMNIDNTKAEGEHAESKKGVSKTAVGASMGEYGYASRELFVQFLVRIKREIPNAVVAIFSKLKYINSPNFEEFRQHWKAHYMGGFVVHSKAFDGLNGHFPIGFLVWDTAKNEEIDEVRTAALDKNGEPCGEKTFFRKSTAAPLSEWVTRPRSNKQEALPLKSALTPTTSTKDVRGDRWADGAIGSFMCKGNDFQNAQTATAILSSGYCSAGAFFITADNIWRVAVMFTVRRIISPTWLNDRDQFLQPSSGLSESFKSDCLVWMLFNASNLSAGANGLEWNGRTWSLVNHFVPFSEQEVGANGKFESLFMFRYISKLKLSPDATRVLAEGRRLWTKFHSSHFERRVRDELKLNRPDVGWYQVRKALQSLEGDDVVDFSSFKQSYASLGDKLRPQVIDHGFLQ
jgi:hypothetical protein